MHPRTQATLERLASADWFAAVGQPVQGPNIVVSNWREAMERCGDPAYQDLCLEAANRYRERLAERSKEAFRTWNATVKAVKRQTVSLVKRKTRDVIRAHQLPAVFLHTVQWDILMVGMEAEFADVYPPGFFASQAFWYVEGHFPCGWDGEFPKGQQVIF